jgi:transcriptional regulator GlxA family with amidase domain
MARVSLEMTTKSVKQITAAAGYIDESSFRRTFKRLYGMSPGTYRAWARARRDAGAA